MSHCIRVIIAKENLIQDFADSWQAAHMLFLKQGFGLIPLTDELHDEIYARHPEATGEEFDAFILLSPAIQQVLKTSSQSDSIAYIETDYFGGEGTQSAILYEKGNISLGPLQSKWIGPINRVLGQIGVNRSGSEDPFDSIGLGDFRNNDDIIDSIR